MCSLKKMYAVVCAAASDAVDYIRTGKYVQAEKELLRALERAEEIFLEASAEETESCLYWKQEMEEEIQFDAAMKQWGEELRAACAAENGMLQKDPSAAVPEETHRRMLEVIKRACENRQSE